MALDAAYMADKPYAQLIGSLMYLAVATRPDLSKAVGVLARFTANPMRKHWEAAIRVCRYLKQNADLLTGMQSNMELTDQNAQSKIKS